MEIKGTFDLKWTAHHGMRNDITQLNQNICSKNWLYMDAIQFECIICR